MKIATYSDKWVVSQKEYDYPVLNTVVNETVLAKYVRVYLHNQREFTADVKDRGEVSGGGRKPWKQKGTGRARHGSTRSPIWKGGGRAFGQTIGVETVLKLNKQERKLAFWSALVQKSDTKSLFIGSLPEIKKTKEVSELVKKLDYKGNVLLVTEQKSVYLASKNLAKVAVKTTADLNAYDILRSDFILMDQGILEKLNNNVSVENEN